MDEIIIGYGSLMSADGLRYNAGDVFQAFKGYFVVNFPKGKRGFWKWSQKRECFTMDVCGFALHCEKVPPNISRPKEGFRCVALVIDGQNSEKLKKNLFQIGTREGYPKCAWRNIVEEAREGNSSVAEYLWNEYSFASFKELSLEKAHRKLKEYRQCLARLETGTSLWEQHIPVPIKIKSRKGKDRFAIVSYAETIPRDIANAFKESNSKCNFVQYIGQCLLAKYHGVDVADISAQLEEMPDLRQRVEAYVRCKASQEAQFPPLLGNETDPPLEK